MVTIMKLKYFIVSLCLIIFSNVSASAFDVVNLPDEVSLSEAIGIYSKSDITGAMALDLQSCEGVTLTEAQYGEIYDNCSSLMLKRTPNKHPFSGLAVKFFTTDGSKTLYLDSGVQIGKFGESSYMCYSIEHLNETLVNLKTLFAESNDKISDDSFDINLAQDFLKLPSEDWSATAIKEAAANGLLPYVLTDKYSQNITRENFCILIANLIAVANNYSSPESYFNDDNNIYQKISFTDCDNADDSIDMLYRMGIVNGKTDTTFEPQSLLTREEAAKILCKAARFLAGDSSHLAYVDVHYDLNYADASSISDWAVNFVKWASQRWIMNGDDNNCFAPKNYYTVDQAVITVNRIYKSLEE